MRERISPAIPRQGENVSLLREGRRTTGKEGREEQQGPSSEDADRLTGLLRPAEANKQTGGKRRRQAKERTQECRDGLSSHWQSSLPSSGRGPASSCGAATAHIDVGATCWNSWPSERGSAERGRENGEERGEGRQQMKRGFMGSCGLAPVPVQSDVTSFRRRLQGHG